MVERVPIQVRKERPDATTRRRDRRAERTRNLTRYGGIRSFDNTRKPAERALAWEEIRLLWETFVEDGSSAAVAHQVALLTGQRRMEILGAKWAEIEEEPKVHRPSRVHTQAGGAWWEIPASRTKSGRPNRVFLAPLSLELLERLRFPGLGPWIFPSPKKTGEHLVNVDKAKIRAREHSGLTGWSIKTMRTTCASRMAEIGIEPATISQVLNHSAGSGAAEVTRRHYLPEVVKYLHAEEKRRAWIRYADRLALALELGLERSKVLEFPG